VADPWIETFDDYEDVMRTAGRLSNAARAPDRQASSAAILRVRRPAGDISKASLSDDDLVPQGTSSAGRGEIVRRSGRPRDHRTAVEPQGGDA
jgi:hypothetical protein